MGLPEGLRMVGGIFINHRAESFLEVKVGDAQPHLQKHSVVEDPSYTTCCIRFKAKFC